MRQENDHEFKIGLGYTVSSKQEPESISEAVSCCGTIFVHSKYVLLSLLIKKLIGRWLGQIFGGERMLSGEEGRIR